MSEIHISTKNRKHVTLCNHNFSHEGIYHPDRVMSEYDLLYMQNGSWDIYEEDECYHVDENCCLLLEPGKRHYSLEKCSPEMRNVYIHFEADADDISGDLILSKLTDCNQNKNVYHYIEKIIEVFWNEETANKDVHLTALLECLLCELSDMYLAKKKNTDVLITEIIHRIHTEPEKFFSPEELAEDYHVSIRTISSRFKKMTGMSVHQYQLALKLNMAYDMLPTNPDRGLRDIAKSLGFYDEYQFSKLFKRQFGISPSKRRL